MKVGRARVVRPARVTIRFARIAERSTLETLQLRASLVWKEYRAALLAHPDAIAIPEEQLRRRQVRVAVLGARVVGFAAVVPLRGRTVELDGLFVEPRLMHGGIGRALVADAVKLARRRGATAMVVTAGPATGFYEKVGFVLVRRAATRFGPAARMRMELGAPRRARAKYATVSRSETRSGT